MLKILSLLGARRIAAGPLLLLVGSVGLFMHTNVVLSADDEPRLTLQLVVADLVAPINIASLPDDSTRRLVLDQSGTIRLITPDGQLREQPFLDIRDRLLTLEEGFEERGLLGMAVHPNFGDRGTVYVTYTAPLTDDAPQHFNYTRVVSEFRLSPDDPIRLDPNSERVLIRQHWPSRKHNGGALAFGPDGFLYIGFGDGGGIHGVGPQVARDAFSVPKSEQFYDEFAQDVQSLFGKILRIDVDHGFPGYAIPEDNPFVQRIGRDEIYAYGFRNPYRISFDPDPQGGFYVTAVAETLWEAVYQVREPGNYGWAIKEGTHCFDRSTPLNPPTSCAGSQSNEFHDPVVEYPNMSVHRDGSQVMETGLGTAVVGAVMYRGNRLGDFRDHLLVADWSHNFQTPSGQLFVATPDASEGKTWPLTKVAQFDTRIVGLIQDDENVYVLTNENIGPYGKTGKVFVLSNAN